jgi:hypothetical protein
MENLMVRHVDYLRKTKLGVYSVAASRQKWKFPLNRGDISCDDFAYQLCLQEGSRSWRLWDWPNRPLKAARDLLTSSGSIFVQIGDENVHRVRAVMDEVVGEDNFIGLIWFRKKTMPLGATYLERMGDYIIWFGKDASQAKFRRLFLPIDIVGDFHWNWRQLDETTREKFSKKELLANPSGDPLRLVSMWPPSFSAKDVYECGVSDTATPES